MFIKAPSGLPQYVGMVTRGSGETFNLIVPTRRMMQFTKTNKIDWALDPKAALPTMDELEKIPVEGMMKPAEKKPDILPSPTAPVAPHAKAEFKFLIH